LTIADRDLTLAMPLELTSASLRGSLALERELQRR